MSQCFQRLTLLCSFKSSDDRSIMNQKECGKKFSHRKFKYYMYINIFLETYRITTKPENTVS
jgi:hypothetical protein